MGANFSQSILLKRLEDGIHLMFEELNNSQLEAELLEFCRLLLEYAQQMMEFNNMVRTLKSEFALDNREVCQSYTKHLEDGIQQMFEELINAQIKAKLLEFCRLILGYAQQKMEVDNMVLTLKTEIALKNRKIKDMEDELKRMKEVIKETELEITPSHEWVQRDDEELMYYEEAPTARVDVTEETDELPSRLKSIEGPKKSNKRPKKSSPKKSNKRRRTTSVSLPSDDVIMRVDHPPNFTEKEAKQYRRDGTKHGYSVCTFFSDERCEYEAITGNVDKHIMAQHSGLIYACNLCPATFKTKENARQHFKDRHLDKKKWKCTISGCTTSYAQDGYPHEKTLIKHCERVHKIVMRTVHQRKIMPKKTRAIKSHGYAHTNDSRDESDGASIGHSEMQIGYDQRYDCPDEFNGESTDNNGMPMNNYSSLNGGYGGSNQSHGYDHGYDCPDEFDGESIDHYEVTHDEAHSPDGQDDGSNKSPDSPLKDDEIYGEVLLISDSD